LGKKQKLNDFLAGEAKIGEKQSKQSNSKYNFMQYIYVFFEKGIHRVQWGLGQSPEAGEFSRIFVLKVTLQSARLLLTVKLQKKLGSRMYKLLPQ